MRASLLTSPSWLWFVWVVTLDFLTDTWVSMTFAMDQCFRGGEESGVMVWDRLAKSRWSCFLIPFLHDLIDSDGQALHFFFGCCACKVHAAANIDGLSRPSRKNLGHSSSVVYAWARSRQGRADDVTVVDHLQLISDCHSLQSPTMFHSQRTSGIA